MSLAKEVSDSIKELYSSIQNLPYTWRRVAMACIAGLVAATVVAWRVMIPLVVVAGAVALFLRSSRSNDSL